VPNHQAASVINTMIVINESNESLLEMNHIQRRVKPWLECSIFLRSRLLGGLFGSSLLGSGLFGCGLFGGGLLGCSLLSGSLFLGCLSK
jgi:hypothetical protein